MPEQRERLLHEMFDWLDNMLKEKCESSNITRAEIAKRLGYKSTSGLTNALRRGTLKYREVVEICDMFCMSVYSCLPPGHREWLGEQSIYKLVSYLMLFREVEEAYSHHRDRVQGGAK